MYSVFTAGRSLGGIVVLAALAVIGSGAVAELSSTPRAETWVTNGQVNAIAATPTTIYIGGNFSQVGPGTSAPGSAGWVPRNCLAALDAATGQATAWNPGADGAIWSLALSGTTLYAGGGFSNIGGQSRNNIAALDTTTGLATAWNPGANESVMSLAVSGAAVYAGGYFSTIGGQSRNSIAALNTTTGLATGWNPGANGTVYALTVSGTTVYAGGDFSTIGGQSRSHIAALDAGTGLAMGWNPDAGGTGAYVGALAVSGTTVYAGGYFSTIGGQSRASLAAIDAATGLPAAWNPGVNAAVYALAVSGGTVYAAGSFGLIGGQSRHSLAAVDAATGLPTGWDPGAANEASALAVSGSTVYAGGAIVTIGGQPRVGFAEFRDPLIDTTPPSGTIVINNDRSVINTTSATLALTWSDGADGSGVVRMRFSNDGANWSAWELLKPTPAHTLPAGEGYKTVRVQFLDKANNRSAIYSDYIRLDTIPPTGGILVNNNASTTTTRSVTLNLNYSDGTGGSGVVRMRFSDDGAHWTPWEYPRATRAHTLPAGLGYHTVRVQYLDAGNNYSPVYNDYIKVVAP